MTLIKAEVCIYTVFLLKMTKWNNNSLCSLKKINKFSTSKYKKKIYKTYNKLTQKKIAIKIKYKIKLN